MYKIIDFYRDGPGSQKSLKACDGLGRRLGGKMFLLKKKQKTKTNKQTNKNAKAHIKLLSMAAQVCHACL